MPKVQDSAKWPSRRAGAGKSKGQAGKGPPGPAVNLASILVVRKAMGKRFTWIYLLAIVGFAILFGLLVNAIGISVKPLAAVCRAVEDFPGVESTKASASRNTLTIKGHAAEDAIRSAVEKAEYTFKGNRTK